MGPRTARSACLWCGWEIGYLVNNAKSRRGAKSKMAAHELTCDESPIVRRNELLQSVNAELTALIKRKEYPRVLENYLNPRRRPSQESEPLKELGKLVRGTVEDDDVLAYARREHPSHCAVCGDTTAPACPMRFTTPQVTHICLICQRCDKSPPTRPVAQVVKDIDEVAELGLLETVFLWKDEARTRMLWGDKLQVETIR